MANVPSSSRRKAQGQSTELDPNAADFVPNGSPAGLEGHTVGAHPQPPEHSQHQASTDQSMQTRSPPHHISLPPRGRSPYSTIQKYDTREPTKALRIEVDGGSSIIVDNMLPFLKRYGVTPHVFDKGTHCYGVFLLYFTGKQDAITMKAEWNGLFQPSMGAKIEISFSDDSPFRPPLDLHMALALWNNKKRSAPPILLRMAAAIHYLPYLLRRFCRYNKGHGRILQLYRARAQQEISPSTPRTGRKALRTLPYPTRVSR